MSDSPFKGPFKHLDGHIWMPSAKGGEERVLDVRGWGYLTGGGSGALGLDADLAAEFQDEFGDRVAEALNQHAMLKAREEDNENR